MLCVVCVGGEGEGGCNGVRVGGGTLKWRHSLVLMLLHVVKASLVPRPFPMSKLEMEEVWEQGLVVHTSVSDLAHGELVKCSVMVKAVSEVRPAVPRMSLIL